MDKMRLLVLALGIQAFATGAPAQQFVIADPDIRIIVDAQELRALVQHASGIRWGGEFQTNSQVCSSPDIHLQLDDADFILRSALSLSSGASAASAQITGRPHAFTNDNGCLNAGVAGTCEIHGCFTSVANAQVMLQGACDIKLIGKVAIEPFPVTWPLEPTLEIVAALPAETGESNVKFDFGRIVDGKWQPSLDPRRRTIRFASSLRTLGGSELPYNLPMLCKVNSQAAGILRRQTPSRLLYDSAVAGHEAYLAFASADEAEQALKAEATLAPGHAAGMSLSQRFLRGTTDGAGLFQQLLPIRLRGTEFVSKTPIEYEVILDTAAAQFGRFQGRDALLLGARVAKATAWIKDQRDRTEVTLGNVGVDAVVSLPAFSPSEANPEQADVEMHFEQFRVSMSGEVGGARLCVNAKNLSGELTSLRFVVARYLGPKSVLPACLKIDNENATALQACHDGVQKKRLSLETPEKNISLELDLARATSGFTPDGRWRISAPRSAQSQGASASLPNPSVALLTTTQSHGC